MSCRRFFQDSSKVLIALILMSVFLRLIIALWLGDTVQPVSGAFDQISYDALGLQVAQGNGFRFESDWWPLTRAGEPTAHWSYLYTSFLAAFYALLGHHPVYPRVFQAILVGILHPYVIWLIGLQIFGRKAALISVAVTAIYSYFIFYSATLMTESLYILAITAVLYISIGLAQELPFSGSARNFYSRWILLGFTLAAVVLLRQTTLFFVPFLLAWIFIVSRLRNGEDLRSSSQILMRPYTKKVLLGILISLAVLSGMIVPWTIRNYVCFNRFVLLNTNAGYAFFWGNHPIHGRNFVSILPAEGPSYQDLIPPTWQRLDEAALEKKLLSQGLKFIIDEPIRFGFLCFGRALEYFKFWPSKESSLISNLARVFSFGIFFPFMILGIWRDYSRNSQPHPWRYIQSPGFVLLLFSICHSAVYFLSWGLIRYRLPVDAVLIVFAGSGIFLTLEKLHTHWSLRSIRD